MIETIKKNKQPLYKAKIYLFTFLKFIQNKKISTVIIIKLGNIYEKKIKIYTVKNSFINLFN